jgi:hypothetical protein
VTVTEVPVCLTTKSSGFLKFTLNNALYDKRLSGNECDNFYAGEKIQLRYLVGYEDFFLFPSENPICTAVLSTLMFIGLVIGSIYYARKKS